MPAYLYRNADGDEREVTVGSAADRPPEVVLFKGDEWEGLNESGVDKFGTPAFPPDAIFRRVYGNFRINGSPVRSRYPIVSHTLPKNLPGCKTDKNGCSVIRNKEHEKHVLGAIGWSRSE